LHRCATPIKFVLSSYLYLAKLVWTILVTVSIMLATCNVWFDMHVCAQVTNCDN